MRRRKDFGDMGVHYHPRLTTNRELSPPIRQITPKNKKFTKLKFIDEAKQGVYIGVFKGAEFKNGLYFVIRPLLHCVLA